MTPSESTKPTLRSNVGQCNCLAGSGCEWTRRLLELNECGADARTLEPAEAGEAQYRRVLRETSRERRRRWRLTAAARLRLRSWVGFS
jgi:hypothetical protein